MRIKGTTDLLRRCIASLITESVVDDMQRKYADRGEVDPEVITRIAGADATGAKRFTAWGCRMAAQGEDVNHIPDVVASLSDLFNRNKLQGKEKDPKSYTSIEQAEETIAKYTAPSRGAEADLESLKKLSIVDEDAEIVYDDKRVRVVLPHTRAASQKYGAGTKWCTAASVGTNYFNSYSSKNIFLYYFIDIERARTFDRMVGELKRAGKKIDKQTLKDILDVVGADFKCAVAAPLRRAKDAEKENETELTGGEVECFDSNDDKIELDDITAKFGRGAMAAVETHLSHQTATARKKYVDTIVVSKDPDLVMSVFDDPVPPDREVLAAALASPVMDFKRLVPIVESYLTQYIDLRAADHYMESFVYSGAVEDIVSVVQDTAPSSFLIAMDELLQTVIDRTTARSKSEPDGQVARRLDMVTTDVQLMQNDVGRSASYPTGRRVARIDRYIDERLSGEEQHRQDRNAPSVRSYSPQTSAALLDVLAAAWNDPRLDRDTERSSMGDGRGSTFLYWLEKSTANVISDLGKLKSAKAGGSEFDPSLVDAAVLDALPLENAFDLAHIMGTPNAKAWAKRNMGRFDDLRSPFETMEKLTKMFDLDLSRTFGLAAKIFRHTSMKFIDFAASSALTTSDPGFFVDAWNGQFRDTADDHLAHVITRALTAQGTKFVTAWARALARGGKVQTLDRMIETEERRARTLTGQREKKTHTRNAEVLRQARERVAARNDDQTPTPDMSVGER